ncbi:MAG: fatty acid desaturase, partial [Verrucomicrobia bacterium]
MNEESIDDPTKRQGLNKIIMQFAMPSQGKGAWQIANTLIPYFLLWGTAIFSFQKDYPIWAGLIPILLAAPFLVRIFIIFHDCCHSSFFDSKWANKLTGYLTGILVFTPFVDWGKAHIRHHATAGNLDRRGVGDIWTLTVEEYIAAPKLKRITYRIFRNPFFLFGLGPAFVFLILQRFSQKGIQHKGRL